MSLPTRLLQLSKGNPAMTVMITGATGLIGRRLLQDFPGAVITSRRPEGAKAQFPEAEVIGWPLSSGQELSGEGPETVFHLAGEPVAGSRWSEERMRRIRASRVEGTRELVDWLAQLPQRPKTLVCASAIGFYGDRGDEELTEQSAAGDSFLAEVCEAWEAEAMRAESLGIRVVCLRIGIVLSKEGGALKEMLPPFKFGVGGPLGNGQQWMAWIHIDDIVGLLKHAADGQYSGVINGVAPEPVRNTAFSKALGKALGRPSFMRAPKFALRMALGKMSAIVLASQRVLPQRALSLGYRFQYPALDAALEHCLRSE